MATNRELAECTQIISSHASLFHRFWMPVSRGDLTVRRRNPAQTFPFRKSLNGLGNMRWNHRISGSSADRVTFVSNLRLFNVERPASVKHPTVSIIPLQPHTPRLISDPVVSDMRIWTSLPFFVLAGFPEPSKWVRLAQGTYIFITYV